MRLQKRITKKPSRARISGAGYIFCLVLILSLAFLSSPGAVAQDRKVSTIEDAKIYREAMTWFSKAEAMIGTEKENSEEQAELFRKALEIKPDFLEAHYDLGLIYANQKKMLEFLFL